MPVTVYESATELAPGGTAPQTVFMRAQYKIETGEAERIAVDHASKPSGGAEGADSPRPFVREELR